jgi:hypothetical protein
MRQPATASSAAHASALCNAAFLGSVVRTVITATRPINTSLAYDPKAAEYNTFCDCVYSDYQPSTHYTIGTEKVFLFLFYQAFRNKCKKGGKKGELHGFDFKDYTTVVNKWASTKVPSKRARSTISRTLKTRVTTTI